MIIPPTFSHQSHDQHVTHVIMTSNCHTDVVQISVRHLHAEGEYQYI